MAAWALELGLLDELAGGPGRPAELASRAGLSERGTSILLGALAELGAVRREDGAYRLTGGGRARFVERDTPDFSVDAVRHWLQNIRRWTNELGGAVRTGRAPPEQREPTGEGTGPEGTPAREADDEGPAGGDRESVADFMAAMANKESAMVERVVELSLERVPDARRALDVGGGPGTFARRFAARGLETVLLDRPEVVDHVSDAYGLRDVPNLRLQSGDFLEELPSEPFDLVLLANITHIYASDTNRRLLARIGERVRPGGAVAILDFVRGLSSFAALFAVTMLLNTEEGTTHRLEDYRSWLGEAGFEEPEWRAVDPDRQLLTARKV